MKRTTERHWPDQLGSDEDRALDIKHRYAYTLVSDFAQPEQRLLDVGSGEGYGSTIARDWVAEYRGVDVSADSVAHAQRQYGGPTVHFDHYAGSTLPYADALFDVMTSFQVIEHVVDVGTYLSEIRRVAAPKAHILITTPNRRLRLADGERPWNRYHLREYDAEGLRAVLLSAFPDVEIFGIRGSAPMERMERARVERARRFAKVDRFGLRYRLPETVDHRVRRLLRRRNWRQTAQQPTFLLADMWRTADDLDDAIDLFAVART